MPERRPSKELLFDPVSLQAFWRVEPNRQQMLAGRLKLLDLRGKVQEVPPSALLLLTEQEAATALQDLWQDAHWQRELLRSGQAGEMRALLNAESAEQFTEALMQLAKTNHLPELEKRFAALEANTAEAAERLAKGYGPSVDTQAFAVPEDHPALVALLALCRSLPEQPLLPNRSGPSISAVQIKVDPPKLDFSTQRIASVLGRNERDMT